MRWLAILLSAWAGLGQAADLPPDSAVAIIRTPSGGGSGFLVALDGKNYIVTNQHVLMGTSAKDVHITFADGTTALPSRPEIGGALDLARLEIDTNRTPLQCATVAPKIDNPVTAVGNSLGAGVITAGKGAIKGIGETEIETDCDFVPGNSGGPILDAQGHVLAVATYIRFGEKNSATKGTRYEKGRRFAVRLHNGMKWIPIPDWTRYAAAGAAIENARRLLDEIYAAAKSLGTITSLTTFKPSNARVGAAISDFERLQTRLSKMVNKTTTAQEIQRNNGILAVTYGMAFQKLRDACLSAIRDLDTMKLPADWGWLDRRRKETLSDLQTLEDLLDKARQQKPTFLSY